MDEDEVDAPPSAAKATAKHTFNPEHSLDMPSSAAIEAAAKAAAVHIVDPEQRGDPRMNLAVEAKLKNPHISLSDALHIGGFRYPHRANAAVVDEENVTLGQRKNQLNRRIRQARLNMYIAQRKEEEEEEEEVSRKRSASSGASQRHEEEKICPDQQHKELLSVGPFDALAENHSGSQHQASIPMLNFIQSAGRNDLTSPNAIIQRQTVLQQQITQDFQHGNAGNFVQNISSAQQQNLVTLRQQHQQLQNFQQHQQRIISELNHNCISAIDSQGMGSNMQSLSQLPSRIQGQNNTQQNMLPLQQEQRGHGQAFSASHLSAYISGGSSTDGNGSAVDTRLDQGLDFFNAELEGLYERVMLQAGFSPEEASVSSEKYQSFAYMCWERECNRLQVLLHENESQTGGMASNTTDTSSHGSVASTHQPINATNLQSAVSLNPQYFLNH